MANFQENFLQLVWKYQYFDKNQLFTTHNIPIVVKKIGFHNFHEGPDFQESHLTIGDLDHFGHVEIHLKSSDWKSHTHNEDERYENVILHVVWKHDQEISRRDGTFIPTLELEGKVFLDVVRNYEKLFSGHSDILCGEELGNMDDILKFSMLERALVERLAEKSTLIRNILGETLQDWEETTYQWLFYNFGFKVNNRSMLKLAKRLPYQILKKHAGQPLIQEALILGQAGFLNGEAEDDYTRFLQKEYLFYRKKYILKNGVYPSEWKFMRVRPSNFPIIRLAQLSAILHGSPHLFSTVLNQVTDLVTFKQLFDIEVSSYWQYHYHLGKEIQKKQRRSLSNETINLLAINFLVPLWYTYGQFTDNLVWQEKCFDLLQGISAEKNRIIQKFEFHHWTANNAFDTQGMIGLHNNYCIQKKCLECKIGQNLLRPQHA